MFFKVLIGVMMGEVKNYDMGKIIIKYVVVIKIDSLIFLWVEFNIFFLGIIIVRKLLLLFILESGVIYMYFLVLLRVIKCKWVKFVLFLIKVKNLG